MNKILLFCALILGFVVTTSMQDDDGADIAFDALTHDFGSIRQGVPVRYQFQFKNTGNETLLLTQGTAPCTCVIVDGTREPISPRGSGIVKVTFTAPKAGSFRQPLVVTSNAKGRHSSITLYVKGVVRPK